jgi:ribonucleoside-diphosphate reductase alpha chain
MNISRRFTKAGQNVFDQFEYTLRSSVLRNPDGSVVFEMRDIEVPKDWSQVATDILAQKYFRKAGVVQLDADGDPILDEDGNRVYGSERSARQVVHRLAGCWTQWGKENGYFDSEADAQAFYDETAYMLLKQMAAPNSPQWFNTGLNFAYDITGPAQGHYYVDPITLELTRSTDAYSRSVPHACFIQSVNDDLVNEGGIFDLITREARVFKYGSGSGSNFSAIRGKNEPLSGGGKSSGLMSFLKVADRAAGAVKSGGTTRRAAKMVILNADHPDIEEFIDWKVVEEQKVAALVAGSKINNRFLNEIMKVASEEGIDYSKPGTQLHELVQRALNRGVPMNYIVRALALVEQGKTSIDVEEYDTHYEGEAYLTVSGQNSNNTVRLTNEFMQAVENDGDWKLTRRTDGKVTKTLKARHLWDKINHAAWSSADPGLQYHTTINEWHTCPMDGEINASNPCCITGDTLIAVADGRNAVPIKELVGQEVPVYAWDHATRRTTISRMWNIGIKRRGVPVYRVTLDDGSSFRATDDHLIMLRDGSYRQVKDLKAGDSLNPFHSHVLKRGESRTKRRYVYTGRGWRVQYRWLWEYANGEQPNGYHIHHFDFDSLNDRLENLRLITAEEHKDLHREKMLGDNNPARRYMNDRWRANLSKATRGKNNPNFGKTHSDDVRAKMRSASADRWSRPEEHLKSSQSTKRWIADAKVDGRHIGRPQVERFERCCPVCRENFVTPREEQIFCSKACRFSPLALEMIGVKGGMSRRGHIMSPEHREKLRAASRAAAQPEQKRRAAQTAWRNRCLKAARLLLDHAIEPSVEQWNELRDQAIELGARQVPDQRVAARLFTSNAELLESAALFNHKVASVEFDGIEDVYDGTVDTHHNFAIITSQSASSIAKNTFDYSGCFIHNSEYMFLDDTACFAPETRISTPHGLRSVEALYAAQERGERVHVTTDIYSEHDHRRITAHRPALVTRVGEREVYRMTLKDGRSVRVTGDHRFLSDDGMWRRVDELQVGVDRIHIRESGNPVAFISPAAEVNRWRALGWLTGDGVFSKDAVAMVFGPQEQETAQVMAEEFNRLIAEAREANSDEYDVTMSRVFDPEPYAGSSDSAVAELVEVDSIPVVAENGELMYETGEKYRTCHLSTQGNGVMQITSKSAPLVRYLQQHYGLKQGTAIYKDVPSKIHEVADDLKVAYLQGLFSADGCIRRSATEEEVMLASSSPELLRSVQLLLSDLGIVGRITWTHPTGRRNPQGQLHIYNQQMRKFVALVGFPCSDAKQARAQEILDKPFAGARKNPRPSRVIAIEPDGIETVYDITEPVTHSVIAEGMIAHNCNLASLNLAHFFDHEAGTFDVEAYRHACRVWTVVLEISVLMAQFPSKEIAQRSFDFRTLGLGYANLGTVLMTAGIPYDSDRGRAWTGALTAILTGEAYAASAELARDLGPFPRYEANKEQMLRVIRNHRRAAYSAPAADYEGLTVKPVGITHSLCPENLSQAAKECWDRALKLGEEHGYRNAQVSVVAPTGTIALVMDCDTTGIEPDFALVKFKKLSGGGYFKIVNQSVPKALKVLGYTDAEIAEIERYIRGHATLEGCPEINRASLKALGFTDEKVDAVESHLENVFDIKFAFNKWTLGDDFLKTLGFIDEHLNDPSLDVLASLGFTPDQIEEANKYVCGTMTIEGAPGLRSEHLPVFDCASKCGRYGKRYIDYMGHVKIMAAAQPFISGAISKTINMPNHATVGEVEHVYMDSWKLMLKAIALYRDGSKLSQPLNATADTDLVEDITLSDPHEEITPQQVQERIVEKVYHRAERRRLPKRRHGFVREATVGGHKVFIRTGEYEDGTLGEVFIDMYKEGASFKGLLNCFAVLASKALQYGMPLEKMVDTFTFTRFEPAGPVFGHEAIKNATSIVDYVFRAIGYEYLNRQDFVHVKAVDETEGMDYRAAGAATSRTEPAPNGTANGNGKSKLSPGQDLYAKQNVRPVEALPAQPVKAAAASERKVETAKAQGYTGDQCGNCGSMRVKQNGACHVCEDCGTTSGCS